MIPEYNMGCCVIAYSAVRCKSLSWVTQERMRFGRDGPTNVSLAKRRIGPASRCWEPPNAPRSDLGRVGQRSGSGDWAATA